MLVSKSNTCAYTVEIKTTKISRSKSEVEEQMPHKKYEDTNLSLSHSAVLIIEIYLVSRATGKIYLTTKLCSVSL